MSSDPMQSAEAPGLAKVEAADAAEICAHYEASKAAKALLTAGLEPTRFLDLLVEKELFDDALTFLSYALPTREAIWWGLRCAREVTPEDAEEPIAAALKAIQAWLDDPSDESRRANMDAAEAATYATPAGCMALVVFFSEGSMAPADCPPVPPEKWLYAKTLSAAVNLGLVVRGQDEIADTAHTFIGLGIEVANGPAPWEEAKA